MTLLNLGTADDDGTGTPLVRAGELLNALLGGVIDRAVDVGAATAARGNAYIVPASATGAWAGQDDNIAIYSGSAWVFYTPTEGTETYDRTADERVRFDGSSWSVVSAGGGGSSNGISRTLIDEIDVSTVADTEIVIDGLSAYDEVIVLAVGLDASASFRTVIQASEDNGATWLTTSGTYRYIRTDAATSDARTTDSHIFVGLESSDARDFGFTIKGLKGSTPKEISGYAFENAWTIMGMINNSAPVTAIRLLELGESANFNSGTVYVYGVTYNGTSGANVAMDDLTDFDGDKTALTAADVGRVVGVKDVGGGVYEYGILAKPAFNMFFEYSGSPSGAETLARFVPAYDITIASGASGAFRVASNPTSAAVVNIRLTNTGGTSTIGTVSIATDGTCTVSITSDTDVDAGDLLFLESDGMEDFTDLLGSLDGFTRVV